VNLNQIITEEYTKLLVEKKKARGFRPKSNYNRRTYIHIPQNIDMTKANVVIYFHGHISAKGVFRRLKEHKFPSNTIIVVPDLGKEPQARNKVVPTNNFIEDVKKKINGDAKWFEPHKKINITGDNLHLMAFSAGGSTMNRFILGEASKKKDSSGKYIKKNRKWVYTYNNPSINNDILKKTRVTYLDATFSWNERDGYTPDVLKKMKNLKIHDASGVETTINKLDNVQIFTCATCKFKGKKKTYKNAKKYLDMFPSLKWTALKRKHGHLKLPPGKEYIEKYRYEKQYKIPSKDKKKAELSQLPPAIYEPGPGPEVEPEETFEDYIFDVPTGKELEYAEVEYDTELPVPEFTQVFEPEEELEDGPKYNPPALTAKKLIKLVQERFDQILDEQAMPLIKVDVILKYEKDFSFYGNVLNQIRSIKGVAIAKASDIGVVDVGADKRMVLMHLKFMPDRPMHQYLTYLQMELKKLKDKNGNRVLATQIKGIPREIEI